ncbi:Csa1 family protein, partial [Staphylococcus hyicus]|nr:Csa1 family protein [Staphylococcus hyicus]
MKKIALSIILITIVIISSSCGLISNKNEIKESFEEKLSMYPIKNLEDFYDKEGFRDEEFNKNDKGTWILYSDMAISEKEDAPLVAKGMVLRINRNTKQANGEYYTNMIKENKKGEIEDNEIT